MLTHIQKIIPVLAFLVACFMLEGGIVVDYADARSRSGGRSFSRPAPRKAPAQTTQQTTQKKGSFSRGLAGGLLGGALGGLLFGSLFGAGGAGMGLLPMLLLAGVGFYLFRRFGSRTQRSSASNYHSTPHSPPGGGFRAMGGSAGSTSPFQDTRDEKEEGLSQLRLSDPDFDQAYFMEVASDVFFQVQAGWMRRDLDSYGHLLGEQLVSEYKAQFEKMLQKGHINKLESIAIRKVEMVACGSDSNEDFITVLFTANLLDYTVDEHTNDLIDGSMTSPVKFAEEWTWARPTGSQDWKLEGIKVVSGE